MTIIITCPECSEEQEVTLTRHDAITPPEWSGRCRKCRIRLLAQQVGVGTFDVWRKDATYQTIQQVAE